MKIIPYHKIKHNNKTFIFHTEIIGLNFDEKDFDKISEALPEANQIIVKIDKEGELAVFDFGDSVRFSKKVSLDKKPKIKL